MVFRSPLPDINIPVMPIFDYIFENHNKYPNKIALIDGKTGKKISYQQLYDKSVSVAYSLMHKFHVKKGDVVALFSPNRWEYPVVFYAITMCGATMTPVNPFYTVDELTHQIKLTNAKIIITVADNFEKVKQTESKLSKKFDHIILFDQTTPVSGVTIFDRLLENKPSHALPEVSINPKQDLSILPTSSGTTGLPKGVMLTHYNLVSNSEQQFPLDGFNQNTVLIAVLPMYHIYGLEAFLVSVIRAGGTLVISTRFVFDDMLKYIHDYQVNVAYLVPPIILQLANNTSVDPTKLTSLKMIQSAAAPLDATLSQRCAKKLNCIVKQAYGMTELSPMAHVSPNNAVKDGSIGILLPNTECRLIGVETGHEVGIGEEGEMLIRGPQMMQGYLNNPQATANTLINGWVHTGDVAKVDKDGYFYVVDRVKELIKVKGFQVAPAELEAIMLNHPAVADTAIVPIPNQESGELPHAFVVLKAGTNASVSELKKFISDQVVPYKRLHGVTFIDAIPKNPSGKILRRLLKSKLPVVQAKM